MFNKIIDFFLNHRPVTILLTLLLIMWGIRNSPFDLGSSLLPKDPVPVDAIPDIGENQQIVYTEWKGKSPEDIDDQITYPLTTYLLGIPGVKTIRSSSMFGLSSIYIIFKDNVDFYWSRSRILEKLNALPYNTLPPDVKPSLGPDATALGQVFWYTLEGKDKDGNPSGGWDLSELRTLQDYYVKYALSSIDGVVEVGSIGGYVREYQVDIDPDALRAYNLKIEQVVKAIKNSNLDVGAGTMEINKAEYLVRGVGYIKSIDDLEESVVSSENTIPIRLKDVAKINFGPAPSRGGLDKGGAEAVGGVVVARYGSNPKEVIQKVKEKIASISPGLPSKVLPDGTVSKVSIVPFYDRTQLIQETLGTLKEALGMEMLISMIVVIVLLFNFRSSILISSMLPVGVLMAFIIMKFSHIDANILALSGIAIAIGVMVDIGIIFSENIVQHIESGIVKHEKITPKEIGIAIKEIFPAVLTSFSITIISFLPVFTLEGSEGKLFSPLAFTKTFSMLSALFLGITILPTFAYFVFSIQITKKLMRKISGYIICGLGLFLLFYVGNSYLAWTILFLGINYILSAHNLYSLKVENFATISICLLLLIYLLAEHWLPLGLDSSLGANILFIALGVGLLLLMLAMLMRYYTRMLRWCFSHKLLFAIIPFTILLLGSLSLFGFEKLFGFMPQSIQQSDTWQQCKKTFPGLGKEFMPPLDEGSFLLMPTTMPHAGVEENKEMISQLDVRVESIPEVNMVVGKWGRADSALDPAPISMFENLISYKSEYITAADGQPLRFKENKDGAFMLKDGSTYNPDKDEFRNISKEQLIEDKDGKVFRQWRKNIKTPDDIWKEIVAKSKMVGLTSAPKLQPIATRLVMLQTGLRAPMGIKIYGPSLEVINDFGMEVEKKLQQVEGIEPGSVFADRGIGKPYIEIRWKRDVIARYGLEINELQKYINTLLGGQPLSTAFDGRERIPIRMRYPRELRDSPEELGKVLITTKHDGQIPLEVLADVVYKRGPQVIKSENTFLMSYVIFDKKDGYAEIDVAERAKKFLKDEIDAGRLTLPHGVEYKFTGNYENQKRAEQKLLFVIPISLIITFMLLYFQYRSISTSLIVFSGIVVSICGGFLLLWLYGLDGFMNIQVTDSLNLRNLFNIHPINLSVAVWIGFITLFGLAINDGVLICSYLEDNYHHAKLNSKADIQALSMEAGKKRLRAALLTSATAIIALLPILTSTGRGSDIMLPIAVPVFGGMMFSLLSTFIVPIVYYLWKCFQLRKVLKNNE